MQGELKPSEKVVGLLKKLYEENNIADKLR